MTKLGKIALSAVAVAALSMSANASEFIGYKGLTKQLKGEAKKNGTFATTAEVKKALKAKDWAVVDVRTMEEWQAAHIKGSFRVGRQNPEKQLATVVLDDDDNFIKKNIIIVCNTASRASIEAVTFKMLGFKNVKIYDIVSWMDECNPVANRYSKSKDKKGTKNKFGLFKAEHCVK